MSDSLRTIPAAYCVFSGVLVSESGEPVYEKNQKIASLRLRLSVQQW